MRKRVDYSALLHCALMNHHYINQFRFSLTFNENVDIQVLQNVVDLLLPRYPLIFTRLKRDGFWYYLETLEHFEIEEDLGMMMTLNHKNVYQQAIHLFYKEKTLSLEVFHGVCDGTGALALLKDIVTLYDRISHHKSFEQPFIHFDEEIKDSYEEIEPIYPKVKIHQKKNLFRFDSKKNRLMVKQYVLPIKLLKQHCKDYSCSINDYLLALFYKSIDQIKENNKNICLSSPINLRKHFNSRTLRNFSWSANIVFKDDLKHKSYSEVIRYIKKEMEIQNSKDYLGYEISRMVKLYHHSLIRYCPLRLKERLIKVGYRLMGEKSCMTISNLGYIEFPDFVEKLEVILGSRYSTPFNCGIISLKENLVISISHDGTTNALFNALEKQFSLQYLTYKSN